MQIRVDVDDEVLDNLVKDIGLTKGTDIAREALTLLKWAASERKQGRQILSGRIDGDELKDLHRLTMPALEKI
jgi:hypothetical protein